MILLSPQITKNKKNNILDNFSISVKDIETYPSDAQESLNTFCQSLINNREYNINFAGLISFYNKPEENQLDFNKYSTNIWKDTQTRDQFLNVLDSLFQRRYSWFLEKKQISREPRYTNRITTTHNALNIICSKIFNNSWDLTKHMLLKSFLNNEDIIAIVNPINRFLTQSDSISLKYGYRRDAWINVTENYSTETCYQDLHSLYNMKKMSFTHNDIEVFSYMPEAFLSEFNYYHTIDEYKFLCSKPNNHLTKRTNYSYKFNEISQNNLISCDPEMMNEITHDFQQPIKMLRLDKLLSTSATDQWLFQEARTKKSFLKRPGTVIPCLYKQRIATLNDDGSIYYRDAYIATLLVNLTLERLKKYTAPLIYLSKLYSQASSYECIKYVNYEKYQSILAGKNQTFIKYSFANTQNYETLAQIIGHLPNEVDLNPIPPLSIDNLHSFVMQPHVDSELEKKKRKITTKFQRAKDTIEGFHLKTLDLSNKINASRSNISNRTSSIATWQQCIEDAKQAIAQEKAIIKLSAEKIKGVYTNYQSTYHTYSAIKEHYNTFNTNYEKILNKNILDKNYKIPSFFSSYDSSDYEILSIKFLYKKDNVAKQVITINNNIDSFIKDFSKEIEIKEVQFQTTKPTKIIPDNKPAKAVVAGPWICKVTSNNLHLKLKDQSSFFGISIPRTRMQLHPHAAKITIDNHADYLTAYSRWQNACLGEAQPLIYNAFEKNDLSLIIMACFVWLKSANSSDVWGKYYREFLPWSHYEDSINDLLLPTEEEIETSIETHQMEPQEYVEPLQPSTPSTEMEYVTEITTQNQQEELNALPTATNNTVALPQEEQTNSQPVYVRYTSPIS